MLEIKISEKLKELGAWLINFVDISKLSKDQNKGYPNAILIGIVLSPEYLQKVKDTPDYVEAMKAANEIDKDEFHLAELKTDRLADFLADYLIEKGYSAYSQSEQNIYKTGFYQEQNKSTPLPHKTIAGLAGLGWIGKHNLIVSPEYGSAISMCTVLTDAPLATISKKVLDSQCGSCKICKDICPEKAIVGKNWTPGIFRDEIVNVYKCTTCLKCMVHCPWTQNYVRMKLQN